MPACLTRLDDRVEAAVGISIAALHAEEARLEANVARVLDAHRALVKAETHVAFERMRLMICADRQRRVDDHLLADLSDQVEILEDAAATRDQAESDLLARIKELQQPEPPATQPALSPTGCARHR
ncbi:hypothetical protein ACIRRH_33615 [Kitasatospora sp. NPDC101235]|uniref:hypothetical protein n=1 Tax=Kitasatospora sp. NPDC101235 TaxID=3364101 RepID=UPI0037F7F8DD